MKNCILGWKKITGPIERDEFTSSPDSILRAQGGFQMSYGTGQMIVGDAGKFISESPNLAFIVAINTAIFMYAMSQGENS